MSKSTTAAAIGGASAAAVVFSASEAREWIGLVQSVAKGESSFLVFCLLILALMVWVLYQQWRTGAECDLRVEKLEGALRTLYSMLATDPNWIDRLPPWEDLLDGKADARVIARNRIIVPPGTPTQP